jgi:hypothetical protein
MIFPTKSMTIACRLAQAVAILWAIATVLGALFICQPISYNWDTSIEGGKCGDAPASCQSTGIVKIMTDVIVLILPIPSLGKVQMALYKKVVLMVMFTLGIL